MLCVGAGMVSYGFCRTVEAGVKCVVLNVTHVGRQILSSPILSGACVGVILHEFFFATRSGLPPSL